MEYWLIWQNLLKTYTEHLNIVLRVNETLKINDKLKAGFYSDLEK